MVVADDYHLDAGGAEYRLALLTFFVLCHGGSPALLAQDQRRGHSRLGRVRTPPSNLTAEHLTAEGRVVREMGA